MADRAAVEADGVPEPVEVSETRGPSYLMESEVKRWLARELHDRVAQILTTMLVEMDEFKSGQIGRIGVLAEVDHFEDSTRAVLRNIRSVLFDLRDEPRNEHGFVETVRSLLHGFQERAAITTTLEVSAQWPRRLNASASYNLLRIIEEALANVKSYSRASRVEVELSVNDDRALARVTDNGHGILFLTNGHRPGLGIVGMKERAALLGGELRLTGGVHGGIVLSATFPVESLQ